MITYDFSRPITVSAGQQLVQVPADALPWKGIMRLSPVFTGANNVLGGANGISSVTVLLDGQTYCIIPANDLIALSELMSDDQLNYGITSLSHTIPFDDPFERAPDGLRELSQLPAGQVELLFQFQGAFASAGSVVVQAMLSDVQATKALQYWNRPMTSIIASTPVAVFPFSAPGRVRAIVLNRTGLARARLVLGNRQVLRMTGPQFPSGPDTSAEVQRWLDAGSVSATDKRAYYLGQGFPAPADAGTYLELDTGAAWVTGNSLTVVTTRDVAPASKAA